MSSTLFYSLSECVTENDYKIKSLPFQNEVRVNIRSVLRSMKEQEKQIVRNYIIYLK